MSGAQHTNINHLSGAVCLPGFVLLVLRHFDLGSILKLDKQQSATERCQRSN